MGAVLTGKTVADAARAEGISRPHASTLVNLDIASSIDLFHNETTRLLASALDAIAAAFLAERTQVVETAVLNLGPDHYVRLTAVKRLIELLLAGRAVPKATPPDDSTGISLEDLTRWSERYWHERRQKRSVKSARPRKAAPPK